MELKLCNKLKHFLEYNLKHKPIYKIKKLKVRYINYRLK